MLFNKINENKARQWTKTEGTVTQIGEPFATKAEFTYAISSGNFYYGTQKVTPDKNDYVKVLQDEDYDNAETSYHFQNGAWEIYSITPSVPALVERITVLEEQVA